MFKRHYLSIGLFGGRHQLSVRRFAIHSSSRWLPGSKLYHQRDSQYVLVLISEKLYSTKTFWFDSRHTAATNATQAACGIPQVDESVAVAAICSSFGGLAIIIVLIRVVERLWVNKTSLWWDDFLVVTAVVVNESAVASTSMLIIFADRCLPNELRLHCK